MAQVSAGDVEEAIRLTRMSKASLLDDENEDQVGHFEPSCACETAKGIL